MANGQQDWQEEAPRDVPLHWRLFLKDLLTLQPASVPNGGNASQFGRPGSGFVFGPARHEVRALCCLGTVVKVSRPQDTASERKESSEDREGVFWIDDSTAVVPVVVKLQDGQEWPQHLALGAQVEVQGTVGRRAGTTEAVGAAQSQQAANQAPPCSGMFIAASSHREEKEPLALALQCLETIELYETCYCTQGWAPQPVRLPAWTPPVPSFAGPPAQQQQQQQRQLVIQKKQQGGNSSSEASVGMMGSGGAAPAGDTPAAAAGGGGEVEGVDQAALISVIFGLIQSKAGAGASLEELSSSSSLPPRLEQQGQARTLAAVSAALDDMAAEGMIYSSKAGQFMAL